MSSFPKDFLWGASTAAYQIEGAKLKDNKGLSVWDVMCETKGKILNGDTGDIACDHYNRYKEDVQIMKDIGLKAYRFSVSWPRIFPDGIGKVNQKGLDFYKRLIDELLKNDIKPYMTLFHWDYPYSLYKKGGWLNDDSPKWFAEYSSVISKEFSDTVENFITLNEPQCYIIFGHYTGTNAPGINLSNREIFKAIHNTLLAHGEGTIALRANSKNKIRIGYAPACYSVVPKEETKKDIEAARKEMFGLNVEKAKKGLECLFDFNSWWLDPVYLGSYPKEIFDYYKEYLDFVKEEDFKTICQPLDFFGYNVYSGNEVYDDNNNIKYSEKKVGRPQTFIKWDVEPRCLYWASKFYYDRYKLPIIITENGLSNQDWVSLDGKVHDPQRIDFLTRYLREFKRAIDDGVKAEGYFTWSLLDNFEWAFGYSERFGLVYVDYETQKRTMKDSAYFYKKIIETNGDIL